MVPNLIPLNLKISEEAKLHIREIVERKREEEGEPIVPALCWISSSLNRGRIPSQPIIGLYNNRSEIEDYIVILDGIEIVIAIPEEEYPRFEGVTLDYRGGQYFLR